MAASTVDRSIEYQPLDALRPAKRNPKTHPGDVVFDPFTGSGSTLLAAHQEGRVGIGIELSARYVDIALARLQRHLGVAPTRKGRAHNFQPSEA